MALILPDEFQFSQSALQDYADCHRRFYLRHVLRQRYPAPESEPMLAFEERMALGERFHQLVQQHQLGLPVDTLRAAIDDEALVEWFDRYLNTALVDLPPQRHAEIALTIPVADRRLIAKYDLLAVQPGEMAVIVDWKTGPRPGTREELANRWQTLLYPYVLAQAGAHLNSGAPIAPEQIRMVYWFAEAPEQTVTFSYDGDAHARVRSRLDDLIAELLARPNEMSNFPLTPDTRHCRFCVYRSFCERGTQAGDALGLTNRVDPDGHTAPSLPLDLEQVAEIAF